MKSISLYIFVFTTLVKSIVSFNCKNVYLSDSKDTLEKATSPKTIENKTTLSNSIEYLTWYIDPCDTVEKEPSDNKNTKCPKGSRACLVKSYEIDGKKTIVDIKAFAVDEPKRDYTRQGSYYLEFDGDGNDISAEFKFSCDGNKGDPIVELDEGKKKVSIEYKGICISDSNDSRPVDDDNDNNRDNGRGSGSGGGHFFLRFIFIIIICYFVIGMCYNFFVLNKKGLEIIPNIEFWATIIESIHEKLSELFGRRGYRPILQ